ncbi:hypothetical protein CC80DRAFT_572612 [Byssothecium circinans]|uniref:Cytochrome b561 domain-containing protein n=1 Tax=Byssothecium circinans TaxID=147558 RepID=A0A6A5THQ3_9PLEO|nr:hypothetical protein CC80DRAFT_572612 [Byssothecium circinans]
MFAFLSSSSKQRSQGWYLPFAILTFAFLLYMSVGLWFTERISSRRYYVRPASALDGILSPETIDALYDDARFHNTLLSLTAAVAKASTNWGEAYGSEELKGLGRNLTQEVARLKAIEPPKKRRSLFNGLSGRQEQGGGGGPPSAMNGTDDLGTALLGSLRSLGGSLTDGLATPAFFLGIGLGMGAENGFNLTTPEQSKAQATKVAASLGQEAKGLNLVAQNVGSGFTAQIAPALGNTTNSFQVGMAAYGLAQGIGRGTAMGLNLTQMKYAPSNATDPMAVASNFGLGIAQPIAANIDVSKAFSGTGDQFNQMLPMIAVAAGQGLGEGASKGLGLMKSNLTSGSPFKKRQLPAGMDPNAIDLPGTIGNFTLGLSESFLQSADLSKVFGGGMNMSSLMFNLDATSLVSISSGAGKGAGEGIAVGLNLLTAVNGTLVSPATSVNGINTTQEQAAEQFVKGMLAGFLQNGGAQFVDSFVKQQTSSAGKNMDVAKAAEGAARGLAEGAVSALSAGGGFSKVLAGDFPKDLPMRLEALPPTTFNDSTGGAVVGFMRGLSGEGVLLAFQQVNAGKNASALKRSAGSKGVASYALTRRQDAQSPTSSTAPSSTPALAIDSNTLEGIAQYSVDAITCNGIGGLAALGLGVMNSPALKATAMASGKTDNITTPLLDPSVLAALPKGPIRITNEGNEFVIKLSDGSIQVNDMPARLFVIMTAAHIILTTLAFFYFLPIYLALGAIQRISVMIGHPVNEKKNKKWRTIFLLGLFAPTGLSGIVLGMIAMGKSKHFGTTHGIFGLIVFLILIPTVVTSFMRLRSTAPPPPPSAFAPKIKTFPSLFKGPSKIHVIAAFLVQLSLAFGMLSWIQGFALLRSISLCVIDAVLIAPTMVTLLNAVLFIQVGATVLLIIRQYFETRIAKREAEIAKNGEVTTLPNGGKDIGVARNDTIKTFGFETKPTSPSPSPPPSLSSQQQQRPPLNERNTKELLGREDSRIGWPANVRKFGEEDTRLDNRQQLQATQPQPGMLQRTISPSPFMAPIVSPRIYNPKLGGFEDDRSPLLTRFEAAPRRPPPIRPRRSLSDDGTEMSYGDLRESSDLDPQSRYQSYAPRPLRSADEEEQGRMLQRNDNSFSRPRPSGEDRRERERGYGGFGFGGR